MTQIWYTSDTHFGHKFVAGLRGFRSPERHDAMITRRWNKRVQPGDTVWVLGDAALGKREDSLRVFAGLNGTKHLVWGNHDNCFPRHQNSWKQHPLYLKYFESVQGHAEHRINGRQIMLSHFPYSTDYPEGSDPRYMPYRLRDEGIFLLHGHLHSSEKITSDHEVHVGLDAWEFYPVPQYRILQIILELEIKKGSTADVRPQAPEPASAQ